MNIFLNKKKFYIFIFIYSLTAIFFALYVEYILQHEPCKLCLYQRIPYIVAIFISFIGYNYFKNKKILILILLVFATSSLISGYHYGIENNIFEEFSGCSGNAIGITNKTELLQSLSKNIKSCKDVSFKIFGQSLASINFILSILITIFTLRTLIYEKN